MLKQTSKRLRRCIGFYNIQNFDKRLYTNHHNHPHYDEFQTINLDAHIYQKAVAKEQQEAKHLNLVIDYNTINEIREEVYGRTDSRITEYPEQIGSYLYTTKLVQSRAKNGGSYYRVLRKPVGGSGKSNEFLSVSRDTSGYKVVFDPVNDQVVPSKYIETHQIEKMELDDSEQFLATIVDVRNDELPTCFIKDLSQNRVLFTQLKLCAWVQFTPSPEEGRPPSGVLYVKKDPISFRTSKVLYHRLEDTFSEKYPVEVFEEQDESAWLTLELSSCREFYYLVSTAKEASKHYFCRREILDKNQNFTQQKSHKEGKNRSTESSLQEDMEEFRFIEVAGKDDGIKDLRVNKKGALVHMEDNRLFFVSRSDFEAGFDSFDQEKSFFENFNTVKIFETSYDLGGHSHNINVDDQAQRDSEDSHHSDSGPDSVGNLQNVVITEIDFLEQAILLYGTQVSKAVVLKLELDEDFAEFVEENSKSPQKNREENQPKELKFEEIAFTDNQYGFVSPGTNQSVESTNKIRFHFDSPFEYNSVYDYYLEGSESQGISSGGSNFLKTSLGATQNHKIELLEQFESAGKKFKKSDFEVKLLHAPTRDGKQVPITLIQPKRFSAKGSNRPKQPTKLLLKTYGCYGLNNDLDFSITNWSLLERDWSIAYAHIRGGSELGLEWHKQATKTSKIVSTFDLLACAEYLIAGGYTHPSLLCGASNSAGGTVLASAVNIRPNLFKAVHLTAPFLDLSTSLLDPSQPLSVSDYAEFGNPLEDEEAYLNVLSLCPYSNIQTGVEYPAVFIEAFDKDFRTPVGNVLKYAARFRQRVARPSRLKEFNDKNIVVKISEGSHVSSGSAEDGLEDAVSSAGFLEWLIESWSLDIEVEG